jgi:hypothetical protein
MASKLNPSYEMEGSSALLELVASRLYPSHKLEGDSPQKSEELEVEVYGVSSRWRLDD